MLQSIGSQRVRHDLATEQQWWEGFVPKMSEASSGKTPVAGDRNHLLHSNAL